MFPTPLFGVRYRNHQISISNHLGSNGCNSGLFSNLARQMKRRQEMLRLRRLATPQSHRAAGQQEEPGTGQKRPRY